MKTVAAEVCSSTPVTISKAASVLSKFVSAENGASQAVNAYLRRATAALDELVRLHSKSDRKKIKKHKSHSSAVTGVTSSRSAELSQGPAIVFENGSKKLGFGNMVDDEGRRVNEVKEAMIQGVGSVREDAETRKKKKDKSGNFDEGRVGEEIERTKHKKNRRNRDSVSDSKVIGVEIGNRDVENGLKMEIQELRKEDGKKRKNRKVDEGSMDEPEEQRSNKKKKKKRRRGGEDDN